MRLKIYSIMATAMVVVSISASPSFSQIDRPSRFPWGGDFPVPIVMGAIGQGEQSEMLYIVRPVIFADGSTGATQSDIQSTITVHNISANNQDPCSQSFKISQPVNLFSKITLKVATYDDAKYVYINGIRTDQSLDRCFYEWSRIVVTVQPGRLLRDLGTGHGVTSNAAHIIPVLFSLMDESGGTQAQSSGGVDVVPIAVIDDDAFLNPGNQATTIGGVSPTEGLELVYSMRPETSGNDHSNWVNVLNISWGFHKPGESAAEQCSQSFPMSLADDGGIYAVNARFDTDRVNINGTEVIFDNDCFKGWSRMVVVFSFIRQFVDGQLPEENITSSIPFRVIPQLLSVIGPGNTTRTQRDLHRFVFGFEKTFFDGLAR